MGVFYHLLTLLMAKDKANEDRYDFIVIDMPATGHAFALTGFTRYLIASHAGWSHRKCAEDRSKYS